MKSKNAPVKAALQALREDINIALCAVLANNPGLQLTLGNCSFDPAGPFTFKLEGCLPGGLSKKEEIRYNLLRELEPALPALGGSVVVRYRTYTVVGANSSATKILGKYVEEPEGKTFLLPLDEVKRSLRAAS